MKQLMLLVLGSAMMLMSATTTSDTIEGKWKTIDDETGQARSIVKIYKAKDGKYYGKILELLNRTADEDADPYCTKCPKNDYRHNKRVIGMNIVSQMNASSDLKSASGGKILDPKKGKIYGCRMTVIEGGAKLDVRGFVAGIPALGRTQTWIRVE